MGSTERKLRSNGITAASGNEPAMSVQVPGIGSSEPVYGLGIVAYDGEAKAVRSKALRHLYLERVDVLVLVDEHVVEHLDDAGTDPIVAEGRAPQQEQVVESRLAARAGCGARVRRLEEQAIASE